MAIGRWFREEFFGLMRPRALKDWGEPFRLAASRVRHTLCRRLAPLGVSPSLSVVTSDWWTLSEAMVVVVVLVFMVC